MKNCFVISPIGEEDSDVRKRSDQILKHIIRPAINEYDYKAVRADEIDKPGIITSQVIQHVVNDPLVIADLTGRNPNVYYELAIRHAIRKPLVQLIQKGERIPFDVAGTRTIQVDHHDLDSVESAKQDIKSQIDSIEENELDLETPISVSLDLHLLRQSENPEERSLADIMSSISDIRNSITSLEDNIDASKNDSEKESIHNDINEIKDIIDTKMSNVDIRRDKRYDARVIRQYVHEFIREKSDPIGLLMLASIFRDNLPWVYESGMIAYRKAKEEGIQNAKREILKFKDFIELSAHHPMSRKLQDENIRMMVHDTLHLIDELLDRYEIERD